MATKCPLCKKGASGSMVTFGGTMGILLVVAVLLFSFAQVDVVKFEAVSGSIKAAFRVQALQTNRALLAGGQGAAAEFQREVVLVRIREKLGVILADQKNKGEVEVVEAAEGFVVRLSRKLLFVPGTMELRKEMKPVLRQVATLLAETPNKIFVTGYTSKAPPEPGSLYASNWLVSAAMAAAIVDFFSGESGMDPARLQVRGMGPYSPRQTDGTAEGREANQRIEVLVARTPPPVVAHEFSEKNNSVQPRP